MTDQDAPYRPVACVLHERLEFAVLRRIHLRLRWLDGGGEHTERVLPLDVTTRDGAEWLTFRRRDGTVQALRLDHIAAVEEAPGG